MKRFIFAIALAGLFACVPPTSKDGAIVIKHNDGGQVRSFQRAVAEANRAGTAVEIYGTCISSCTMFVAVKDVCMGPKARLGFHGTSALRGRSATAKLKDDKIVAQYYPPAMRRLFMDKWRHNGMLKLTYLNRDEVQALAPNVKDC